MRLVALLAGALTACVPAVTVPTNSATPPPTPSAAASPTAWEYLAVNNFEGRTYPKDMKQLGAEGWELVAVVGRGSGTGEYEEFWFKRPLGATSSATGSL